MSTGERGAVSAPLFPHLLGPAFDALPASVQRLHLRAGRATYAGHVSVLRGERWLARLCARATRLPPAGDGPIRVDIETSARGESWTRHVGRHAMHSRLWAADGLLCERLGLVTFGFRLGTEEARLTWRVARVRAVGVPLPARLFSKVIAYEGETRDGRYTFDVSATLPLIGPLVHYRGWLHVDG